MRNALVVYVGGVPAAGKSTLFRGLRSVLFRNAVEFSADTCKGVAAGPFRMLGVFDGSTFEGTDKLSMAVIGHALDYLDRLGRQPERTVVFVEGDRLLCDRFIRETLCRVFILEADERVLAFRRAQRAAQGKRQTATFWKAKATKIANIKAKYNPTILRSDTAGQQAENVRRLVAIARAWV